MYIHTFNLQIEIIYKRVPDPFSHKMHNIFLQKSITNINKNNIYTPKHLQMKKRVYSNNERWGKNIKEYLEN